VVLLGAGLAALAWRMQKSVRNRADFPDGYDAVQAAPNSHRVLFENALVRVLEVSVAPGTTVPMHHHRWPSLVVDWDTGGHHMHYRYQRADGMVRDIPSTESPTLETGSWSLHWMEPEGMHSVANLDAPGSSSPKGPAGLRIELKTSP
jgi:predicted metal-dependent enzyme (double-stranded beta helix superfamily)